jgi:hypothetical protein
MNDILAKAVLHHDVRTVELEFRIGITGSRGFKSCVGETRWNTLRAHLGEGRIENTIERMTNDGSKYVISNDTKKWIHKKRLGNEDSTTNGGWCIRASTSLEIQDVTTPEPTSWRFQRKKHRVSYDVGAWRIDLTKVSSTPPADVDTEFTYEVEIELADPKEFFSKELGDILASGRQIAEDMIGFMT